MFLDFKKKILEDNKGYTFVELIVSMMIISFFILNIAITYNAINKLNTKSENRSIATSLAESIITQFKDISYDGINGQDDLMQVIYFPDYIDIEDTNINYEETDINKKFKINDALYAQDKFSIDIELIPNEKKSIPKIDGLNNNTSSMIELCDIKKGSLIYDCIKELADHVIDEDDKPDPKSVEEIIPHTDLYLDIYLGKTSAKIRYKLKPDDHYNYDHIKESSKIIDMNYPLIRDIYMFHPMDYKVLGNEYINIHEKTDDTFIKMPNIYFLQEKDSSDHYEITSFFDNISDFKYDESFKKIHTNISSDKIENNINELFIKEEIISGYTVNIKIKDKDVDYVELSDYISLS